MSDRHSFFLVIEGLDGSGKSEISRRLAELLRATLDDRVMLTFEPHDPSAAGLYIRRVLRKKILVSSHTLALAFALNRSDHNERVIGPFLEQNSGPRLVLCDRYVLSSLVYNSSYDLSMDAVWELNSGARRPDLTLFLDASAEICYARMGSRGGNRELFESNLSDSRARYFEAIDFLRQRGEHVMVVDGNPDLLTVLNSIIDVLKTVGPRWLTLQKLMFLEATAPAMLTPPPLELDRWMRDFVDRYTVPVLAEAALDDGIRRLVVSEVNNLSLDELTALMMNFLQTDRRYRFESAWPGQPIDYTIIRPGGESGGLVILQDERRWEGVMRALESEFIAPHYSIRRDSIQFVVALDPSHAGEEVAQFVPDTGSVPVEVYGRGTLIQHFTRYITRRVSAEFVPTADTPQLSMDMPEGSTMNEDWSLAAAMPMTTPEPAAPEEAAAPSARPSRTATQEIWLNQQDYIPGPDAYLPVAEDYYQEQEGADSEQPLAYTANPTEPSAETFDEPLVMDFDTGEIAVLAEAAVPPPPEAETPWSVPETRADAEPVTELAQEEYVFAPAPDSEMPLTPADIDTGADLEPYAFAVSEAPWASYTEAEVEAGTIAEPGSGDDGFSESDVPLTPADVDTGADLEPYAFAAPDEAWAATVEAEAGTIAEQSSSEDLFAEPNLPLSRAESAVDTEYTVAEDPSDSADALSKWDTREDLAAVDAGYALDEEPSFAAEPAHGFNFDLPAGDALADIYAAAAITQSEMDAIAALYSGLDDALRAHAGEPDLDSEQEEELG